MIWTENQLTGFYMYVAIAWYGLMKYMLVLTRGEATVKSREGITWFCKKNNENRVYFYLVLK